jgi:radical SAM protein with 4Fe4S-binding SPASM domain
MKPVRINRLVIKPTLKCTADCDGCSSRRNLHRTLSGDKQPSLMQWKTMLQEAAGLGLRNLHISGGEPTLYPHLIDLIIAGKKLGLRIRINSNGSMITEAFAQRLLEAGLDEICISLYSHEPAPHNRFRKSSNLWQKATRAVQIFSELRKSHPNFFLGTMSVILRENYHCLDSLIRFHHRLGSQQIGLSYLEGDFSGKYLLNREEIREFRNTVVPRAVSYCRSFLDPRIKNRAINVIQSLYSKTAGPENDLSQGIYWPRKHCNIPRTTGLVMANGDIHPCNFVEYTHQPIMGNLFQKGFKEIWHSKTWNTYRKTLNPLCRFCPVNIYNAVPLAHNPDTSFLVPLYHSRALAPFRPLIRELREIYRMRRQRILKPWVLL